MEINVKEENSKIKREEAENMQREEYWEKKKKGKRG